MQPTILACDGDDVDTNDNTNQERSAGKSRRLRGVVEVAPKRGLGSGLTTLWLPTLHCVLDRYPCP